MLSDLPIIGRLFCGKKEVVRWLDEVQSGTPESTATRSDVDESSVTPALSDIACVEHDKEESHGHAEETARTARKKRPAIGGTWKDLHKIDKALIELKATLPPGANLCVAYEQATGIKETLYALNYRWTCLVKKLPIHPLAYGKLELARSVAMHKVRAQDTWSVGELWNKAGDELLEMGGGKYEPVVIMQQWREMYPTKDPYER